MTDLQTQYNAVRNDIGLIDRSSVGKIAIYGADRFSWLQGMVSNDVRLLQSGAPALQACILDATGHILSDVTLMNAEQNGSILVDLPIINKAKVLDLFNRYIISEDVEIEDFTSTLACLSIQGPKSLGWMMSMESDRMFNDAWDSLVFVIDADYTGSKGVDIYFASEYQDRLRQSQVLAAIVSVEAEAQEVLRVEAGIAKYGVDMDETTLAPEAGLMATHISLTKGCYVGQEIVARIDSRGHTNRALTGLVFAEGDVPASGDKIFAEEEDGGMRESGRITSVVSASPAMNGRPIALGYVRHEHRAPGSRVQVQSGTGSADTARTATVVELPFYRKPERAPQLARQEQADTQPNTSTDARS